LSVLRTDETSVDITFPKIIRHKRYIISGDGINRVEIQSSEVSNKNVTAQITGLTQGTTSTFQVVVVATDVNGNEVASEPTNFTVNTKGRFANFLTSTVYLT